MSNHFTNYRVREFLRHTLGWPTRFSNFLSKKDSITSVKPKTWEITQFFWEETLPLSWKQISAFFLTLEQRRPQTYLSKPLSFCDNCLIDKLRCHFCCIYVVNASAYHQEEELRSRQGKQLAVRRLFLRLRDLIYSLNSGPQGELTVNL